MWPKVLWDIGFQNFTFSGVRYHAAMGKTSSNEELNIGETNHSRSTTEQWVSRAYALATLSFGGDQITAKVGAVPTR
jgi:hypothetical protein